MLLTVWLLLDFFVALAAILAYLRLRRRVSHKFPLPPGPRMHWLKRADLPRPDNRPWLEYAKWGEKHGDVCYIDMYGNPIIILNSSTAVHDLFERRSHNYSSRTVRPMLNELMGWNWIFSSMPYGDHWRKHRRLFMKHFHSTVSRRYLPLQVKETNTLLRDLLQDPSQFAQHVRRSSAAITLMISYGYEVTSLNDEYVTLADEALALLGRAGLFGTYLVDYIPILKHIPTWFPGADFKRKARKWKELTLAMKHWPYDLTKQRIKNGTAIPSITAVELEAMAQGTDGGYYDEEIVQNVAGISYAAGSETTVSVILAFILAMTMYSDVQKRAQAEIDSIVGRSRLPTVEDRDRMPFVNGVVLESLRWNPVIPLGLPHKAVEDDVYRGMLIPANATIFANVWALLHDPDMYPEPNAFRPERYSDKVKPGMNKYPVEAFGFGRRICPGRHVAEVTVWLAVARTLACFDISKALDESGNPIQPSEDFTSGLLSRPKPFKCRITPRTGAIDLINQAQDEQ